MRVRAGKPGAGAAITIFCRDQETRRHTGMTAEEIEKIKQLYHAALERVPEERAGFLDEACEGDLALLARVEELIATREEAEGLFARPAWESLMHPGPGAMPGSRDDEEVDPNLPFERLGDFRLIRKLGGGGMGVVYLAEQESLGRHVALKIIHPDRAGSFEAAKRFWREVEAISGLRHPNIVTVFESGEAQGIRYFAMELVPGNDLDQELREAAERNERIPTSQSLRWINDIARALDCAHGAGIIHRDVKPSNIRIAPEGRAMLMDFGVARHLDMSTLTLTGEFRGTPHYASPEQVKARPEKIDARSDIYSLGAVLYEAVTGCVPFQGETTEQVFRQILHKDPVPPRRLNPALSRDVQTVIAAAMEKDRSRRYQTMAAFGDDLQHLLAGEMIEARPAGLPTRVWKRVRRNPLLSAAIGVALAAVAVLVLSLPWYMVRISKERDRAVEEAERNRILFQLSRTLLSERLKLPVFAKDNPKKRLDRIARDVDSAFPDPDESKAWFLEASGILFMGGKYYDDAISQMRAALDLRLRIHGPEHQETQEIMGRLARLLFIHSRPEEAKDLLRQVLEIQERSLGKEHPKTLATLNDLAPMLSGRSGQDEMEALFRRLLAVRQRVLGVDDPETVATSIALAETLLRQGKFSEAEPLFQQAFEFHKRVFRFSSNPLQCALRHVDAFYTSWGKFERAAEYRARVGLPASAAAAIPAVSGTTRSDGAADGGRIDMGYHYPVPEDAHREQGAEDAPIPATALLVPDAYPTIQDAIRAAGSGDTIVVRPGSYVEKINFLGKAVAVLSESGPDVTVIDGSRSGSTVTFDSGEDRKSRLEGFTITNGSGTRSLHNLGYAYGGGIFCFNSSPVITGNIIQGNVATATCAGGGISCRSSSPLIAKNRIVDNASTWAGGIHLDSSFAVIENNTISRNAAVEGFAGGISCYYSSPVIRNNFITRNRTDTIGGGIVMQKASPTLTNNVIAFNRADIMGGAFCCKEECFPVLVNNTVFHNECRSREGRGAFAVLTEVKLSHATISRTIFRHGSAPAEQDICPGIRSLSVSFCNVEDGFPGRGNIDADPLFVDPDNGDFHLRQEPCQPGVINPCVDAGN